MSSLPLPGYNLPHGVSTKDIGQHFDGPDDDWDDDDCDDDCDDCYKPNYFDDMPCTD